MSTGYWHLDQLEPRYLMSAAAPLGIIAATAPYTPFATTTSVSPDEQKLAADNTDFAFNLYHQLESQSGNIFFSPLSISAAMAMLYAGANGQTAQQISQAMSFLLPNSDFASTFGDLLADLTAPQATSADGQTPTLDIANSLWGQTGFPFLNSYLQTLSRSFQSQMNSVDFKDDPEAQRAAINQWVADNTGQMIQNLLPEGSITQDTRLELANAIYFNAPWLYSFDQTVQQAFHLPGGDVNVDMMKQLECYNYASGSNYQAVEIPYAGNESMEILLPTAGQFDQFDSSLTASEVQNIEQKMRPADVNLSLPKFGYEQATDLTSTLQNMGITDAFDGNADLSGIDGQKDLAVSDVIHKAKIEVSDKGTKAAGATAIVVTTMCGSLYPPTPPPPIDFTVDHPFIYLIKDNATGSTLFMGRVSDASAFPAPTAPTAPVADPVTQPPEGPILLPDPTPVAWPPNPVITKGPAPVAQPSQNLLLPAGASPFAAMAKYDAIPATTADFVTGLAGATTADVSQIASVASSLIGSSYKAPALTDDDGGQDSAAPALTSSLDAGNDCLASQPTDPSLLAGAADDLAPTLP